MAARVPEPEHTREAPIRPAEPAWGATLALAGLLLLALLGNGRAIGAGDTRPTERLAASLAGELDLDLDEFPEIEPPFAREVLGHRVSVYPAFSAVLAAPLFALARPFLALDETGTALLGKLAASLFSALAAGLLFRALSRRGSTPAEARWCAAVFALGTSVWSTSQALWQHPAAVLFLTLALLFLLRAEDDPAWAGRAGLPLALCAAARHADAPLVAVLALGVALRWPRQIPRLLAWGAAPVLFVLAYDQAYFGSPFRHGFSGRGSGFSLPTGEGHLGLLLSPARGLLVFTPVVLVCAAGLLRAFQRGERLAGACAAAILAQWAFLGCWGEWHGGESWGPRMMTDVLPLLFLFLPEGIAALPRLAGPLALLGVLAQAVGAFSYDYRWDRLHRDDPRAALWDPRESPLLFHLEERVLLPSLPVLRDGRAAVREHPLVVFGPTGSRVAFADGRPRVLGPTASFGDVILQRGARVEGEALKLSGRWDGIFLRVLPEARSRRLELRVVGSGQGHLYVGERSFWSAATRWATYPIGGAFRIRHPYEYATSGGGDLVITLGKAAGAARIARVMLVPPAEPDEVLTLR